MSLIWIPFTIMAAFMQSWRNALQKQLRNHAGTLGVTLARFIVALPLSGLYLWCLYQYYPTVGVPEFVTTFSVEFFSYLLIAALAQIAATAFMVMLFKSRNYAIGVGLAKSEAVIAATLGALFFASPLSMMAWIGVIVGGVAVWLMSLGNAQSITKSTTGSLTESPDSQGLSSRTIITGLASGLFFALCTLFIRESALMLRVDGYNFLISASWVLFFILLIQTVVLTVWLALCEPDTLKTLYKHKNLTTGVSLFSLIGSIGWFTAMSLQTVAMVKTLGQVEVLFTLAISAWWFKEQLGRNDYLGLGLIVLGAVLVMLA